MHVSSLCSPVTVNARRWESLTTAAERMRGEDLGSLAVVDETYCVGVLTERHIVRAVADGADLELTRIDRYMTEPPLCASLETDTADAAALMREHRLRHLPVLKHGRIVGMLSMRDVLVDLTPGAWNVT